MPYDINTTADQLVSDFNHIIKDKIILTTGVTPGGLASEFVQAIAKAQPKLIILSCRNVEKTLRFADKLTSETGVELRINQLQLDSLAAVRKGAEEVNDWTDVPYIDVIVNSAAIMGVPYKLTGDGIESQFAINHLSHYLFTNLLMGKILAAKEPRIVNISSAGHRFSAIRFHDVNFSDGETYVPMQAYGQAKTANILFSLALADKLGSKGLQAYSVHPGTIGGTALLGDNNLQDMRTSTKAIDRYLGNKEAFRQGLPMISAQQGTASYVLAAFSPDLRSHNGTYILESRVADPKKGDTLKTWARDRMEAELLWQLSEELVGEKFEY